MIPGSPASSAHASAALRFALVLAAFASVTGSASAQIVRGTVAERMSGVPVAGVVITLERIGGDSLAAPQAVATGLSDERGEYAVRALVPGRYRIGAKRIGVRRYASEPFDLAEGEARRVDVQLAALLFTLPEIVVEASVLCATRRGDLQRVNALWDEAQAALTATQISARDRLVRARVGRYALTIYPDNIGTIRQWRSELDSVVSRPFTSLSADSLSEVGYWRDLPGDSAEYYGPDAEVLLSDVFRHDHCYSIAEGRRDRPGLIGLAFEPVPDRKLPDVVGTLWLDSRTFDLRFVEFQYSRLPYGETSTHVGGEVHFQRLPSGAWIVNRWFIRMPQFRRNTSAPAALRAALDSLADILRLVEEGGSVVVANSPTTEDVASLSGVVHDSSGGPLRGAQVRIPGTALTAPVDERGRFSIDSVPAGNYSVVVEHDGYALLGMLAAHTYVSLAPGASKQVNLRAARARTLVARMCNGRPPVSRRATLRVIMLDSATSQPFRDVTFRLSWVESSAAGRSPVWREQRQTKTTDHVGRATFCAVPASVPLELSIERPGNEPLRVSVLQLAQNQLAAHVVYARLP